MMFIRGQSDGRKEKKECRKIWKTEKRKDEAIWKLNKGSEKEREEK